MVVTILLQQDLAINIGSCRKKLRWQSSAMPVVLCQHGVERVCPHWGWWRSLNYREVWCLLWAEWLEVSSSPKTRPQAHLHTPWQVSLGCSNQERRQNSWARWNSEEYCPLENSYSLQCRKWFLLKLLRVHLSKQHTKEDHQTPSEIARKSRFDWDRRWVRPKTGTLSIQSYTLQRRFILSYAAQRREKGSTWRLWEVNSISASVQELKTKRYCSEYAENEHAHIVRCRNRRITVICTKDWSHSKKNSECPCHTQERHRTQRISSKVRWSA